MQILIRTAYNLDEQSPYLFNMMAKFPTVLNVPYLDVLVILLANNTVHETASRLQDS